MTGIDIAGRSLCLVSQAVPGLLSSSTPINTRLGEAVPETEGLNL